MKKLINKRSVTIFVIMTLVLIAITSFLSEYTGGSINLTSPFFSLGIAFGSALLFEKISQEKNN